MHANKAATTAASRTSSARTFNSEARRFISHLKYAQLSQETHAIFLTPMFYNFAIRDPSNIDSRKHNPCPRCRDAHKVAGMGARHRDASNHLVTFRDQIVDHCLIIRETRQHYLM